jgi:hypothetical protein
MEEGEMKVLSSVIVFAVLLAFVLSCSQNTTFTLSSAYGTKVLVAHDKDVMERMIACGITGECDGLCVMELLPSGKVFSVKAGTKVMVRDGFSFSHARKIHILEGECSGKEGWVYDRALYEAHSDVPFQQALARLYQDR